MWAAGFQKVAKIEEDSEYFCTLPLWRVSQIWLNITKLPKKKGKEMWRRVYLQVSQV